MSTSLRSAKSRLWQLISPTLPIGAYSYSQGLEYAIEAGWVRDETSTEAWILGQARHNLARLDAPLLLRLYLAWQEDDYDQVLYWNDMILALRESAELRMEDIQLGNALLRVLQGLDIEVPGLTEEYALVSLFSFACQHWEIDKIDAVQGYLWSWCENQVAAAIKLVPLGQTSGQKLMFKAADAIQASIAEALQCNDEDIGLLAPGLAIASALHETQYTRLFRS